jgi:hypothetical protein
MRCGVAELGCGGAENEVGVEELGCGGAENEVWRS